MPDIYLIIVIILFVLAISDLIVGVSNDAVNFLNSAIGSQVASRNVIMIVASVGVFIGATFSSGMMEVARSGIFNPQYFYFSEIMIIFLAVMITDIILLDLFNTFGLPTSTTVSIVFELLGAAVAVSVIKLTNAGESLGRLGDYINSSSAVVIISGIFLSVFIAFIVGTIVQYISRLLFTFHIRRRIKWVGGIWSGLALSALTYFLLIKGVKGASFISASFLDWVSQNTVLLFVIAFAFWTVVMQICVSVFRVNILGFVVLFGTFALAMAFAGNDLVNFIGVPIAGLESFIAYSNSGTSPDELGMGILNEPVRTKTYLLVGAGLVMVLTLWFSKKARSVTETEVNLGRQSEGNERFKPNRLSKTLVRATISLRKQVDRLLPESFKKKAAQSFIPFKMKASREKELDPPAFDMVRASVNLTAASALIAFATSLKLPLSTTYVSFMVAMGSSLADKAWGRSSAVFRIAGVFNVIGGWFFTAFMAFTAASIFAVIIYFFGIWGIGALVVLAVMMISRTFLIHNRNEKKKSSAREMEKRMAHLTTEQIIQETTQKVTAILGQVGLSYHNAIEGLINEDLDLLKKTEREIQALKEENTMLYHQMYHLVKRIEEGHGDASRVYILFCDLAQDFIQSIGLIVETSAEYVDNSLEPLSMEESEPLKGFEEILEPYLNDLSFAIARFQFKETKKLLKRKSDILLSLEEQLTAHVEGIKNDKMGMRKSQLLMSIMLETKDLVAVAARFVKLYRRVQKLEDKQAKSLVVGEEDIA